MTKSRDNKQTIRAYMRTHDVNYTTAKRAITKQASRKAALRATIRAAINENDTATGSAEPETSTPSPRVAIGVDLTGRCVCAPDEQHAGHRDDCPERLKAFPPRTADEAAGIVHPPVTLDMTRAPFTERVRHPHIHDLDGRCAKNRNGNSCATTTSSPRVAIGVDPDPNYVHSVIHTLNGPALTGGLGTGEPVTPSAADLLRTAARATNAESFPDGATVRLWQATALDPNTGQRVPTVVTQVRHPADETGHHKITTHTALNAQLDPNQHVMSVLTDEPVPTPSRRDNLKAALRTGNEDTLNAHLRAHAPGPHIDDLHAALEQLADLELELREHTDDPETPVTYEMLRHATQATTTHGTRWGGSHGIPSAADVCRAHLLGTPRTDGPYTDDPYTVWPEDLAATIEAVADDDAILAAAAEGTTASTDDIAEELLILANGLCKPAPTPSQPSNTSDKDHYLVVTDGDRYVNRRYKVECTTPAPLTGKRASSCEGWEECPQCALLGADQWDTILDTGTAHGIEHIMLTNGPATPTGQCALIAFPEAWEESDAIHNLPPGRYAINHTWDDEYATLWLRTQ